MTQIRDAERTKQAILNATVKLLADEGTGLTIARVAEVAGVSKGGLLHHFNNREQLFYAATVDSIDRFRDEVMRLVDLSENTPGKLLRAYVRGLCGGSEFVMRAFSHGAVWAQLNSIPGAVELNDADSELWEKQLSADGLDNDVILIVRLAAEGAVTAWLVDPTFTDDDLALVRKRLIELTLPDEHGPARLRGAK